MLNDDSQGLKELHIPQEYFLLFKHLELLLAEQASFFGLGGRATGGGLLPGV